MSESDLSVDTSDITAYRQEVFNFLASLTLKYAPMADLYNNTLSLKGYTVESDPLQWKYYLNLQGEYHSTDTMMTVVSLDTRAVINFTKSNLQQHFRTATAYVPGTSYYEDLCSRYPDQTDLIKSIVYPVSDINLALSSDDLTILSYGKGFLESTEEAYIIEELNAALAYISNRWYFTFLNYEPYFFTAFWTMLWQILPQAVFSARMRAIKTTNVHSWHIWQYLTSNGIGDYSDILSRRQSMFLYRNMEYLLANRGKQSNLILLVNNLLEEIGVGLFGRDVLQQTVTGSDLCELTPTLTPVKIPTVFADQVEEIPSENMSDTNLRLIAAGNEVMGTAEYVESVERKMSDTVINTYPTKLVEIRPIARGKKYADYFNVFVMDTLVYATNAGVYTAVIELADSENSASIELTVKEALVLMYYAIHRRNRETPVYLPNSYTCNTAFKQTLDPIPETIDYLGSTYYVANLVDLETYIGQTPYYPANPTNNPTTFSNLIGDLFLQSITQVMQSRLCANLVASKAMEYVSAATVEQSVIPINFIPGATTYDEWFSTRSDIFKGLISSLESQFDPFDAYDQLTQLIMTQLIPITSVLSKYGNFQITDQGYTRLKQLFVQLCSYNITFLDTNRDVGQFMYVTKSGGVSSSETYGGKADAPGTVDARRINNAFAESIAIAPSDVEFGGDSQFDQSYAIYKKEKIKAETTAVRQSLIVNPPVMQPLESVQGASIRLKPGIQLVAVKDYTYSE